MNLSHGSRSETGNQKLTAIVKPQPAVNYCSSNSSAASGHLGGLNHSPQSLFVPTQVPAKSDDEFCNIWQSLQGSGKIQPFQPTVQDKGAVLPQEISQVTQPHKTGFNDNSVKYQQKKHDPHRKLKEEHKSPKAECQTQKLSNKQTSGASAKCNIKLLKRNDSPGASEAQTVVTGYPAAIDKPPTGIENFLASLNISKESGVQSPHHGEPPDEEHLSPQSFAMKGTRMLKEILKIDSPDTTGSKNDGKQFDNEVTASPNRRDEHGLLPHPEPSKKLACFMNKPHGTNEYQNVPSVDSVCWPGHIPPVSTPVTELARICSLVGMPQPDFSFLRTTQTMTVCQVKLSNGLLVHGPQCHSESEAKERAALFALQQLGSFGVNYPLPPPIFPNYPPAVPSGTIPPIFPQPAANIMPSSTHLFGSVPWRPPVPVAGKAFHHPSYPGTMPLAGGMPSGAHNQFIPLQVTKKRVANRKHFENKEAQSSQATPLQTSKPGSSEATQVIPQESPSASLKCSQDAQSMSSQVDTAAQGHGVSHQKPAPSSSRRKSRKLAVNFSVPKPSE